MTNTNRPTNFDMPYHIFDFDEFDNDAWRDAWTGTNAQQHVNTAARQEQVAQAAAQAAAQGIVNNNIDQARAVLEGAGVPVNEDNLAAALEIVGQGAVEIQPQEPPRPRPNNFQVNNWFGTEPEDGTATGRVTRPARPTIHRLTPDEYLAKKHKLKSKKDPFTKDYIKEYSFDEKGNLYYSFKEQGYDVSITSDKLTDKLALLKDMGTFYTRKENIELGFRRKAINTLQYGVQGTNIALDRDTTTGNMREMRVPAKWFLPHLPNKKKEVIAILKNEEFHYFSVSINISKFTIQLTTIPQGRRDSIKLFSIKDVKENIALLNERIGEALLYAKKAERNVFNRPASYEDMPYPTRTTNF